MWWVGAALFCAGLFVMPGIVLAIAGGGILLFWGMRLMGAAQVAAPPPPAALPPARPDEARSTLASGTPTSAYNLLCMMILPVDEDDEDPAPESDHRATREHLRRKLLAIGPVAWPESMAICIDGCGERFPGDYKVCPRCAMTLIPLTRQEIETLIHTPVRQH